MRRVALFISFSIADGPQVHLTSTTSIKMGDFKYTNEELSHVYIEYLIYEMYKYYVEKRGHSSCNSQSTSLWNTTRNLMIYRIFWTPILVHPHLVLVYPYLEDRCL